MVVCSLCEEPLTITSISSESEHFMVCGQGSPVLETIQLRGKTDPQLSWSRSLFSNTKMLQISAMPYIWIKVLTIFSLALEPNPEME